MGKKVLVVDDEEDILDIIVVGLSIRGYKVTGATSLEYARELLEEKPDCILVDRTVGSDQGDGFRFCVEIRSKYTGKIGCMTVTKRNVRELENSEALDFVFNKMEGVQHLAEILERELGGAQ